MSKPQQKQKPKAQSPFRRVGAPASEPAPPFAATFAGRATLCLLTVGLLSLAFAPVKQFYLAWVGLAPWLLLVAHAKGWKSAFFWSWLTGILFAGVNIWWLGFVTLPGSLGLLVYIGFWLGVNALVLRAAGTFEGIDGTKPQAPWRPILAIGIVAVTWVAQEWIRGNLFTGFPWLYLGHTQTPVLITCQVADLTGVYGVTFWVVLINAWVAFVFLYRLNVAKLAIAGGVVILILCGTLGYGLFRMGQKTLEPGPTIMVVQPNYPQDNSGQKGAGYEEIAQFHFKTTATALSMPAAQSHPVDLVVWSETMMPELNAEYRQYSHGYVRSDDKRNVGQWLDSVHDQLGDLAKTFGVNLLVGGHANLPDRVVKGRQTWSARNSAFLFDRAGRDAPFRYDKIHLVPFGEYIPFKDSFPPLYAFFNLFNPYKDFDYTLTPGGELTVFSLSPKGPTPATLPSSQPSVGPAEYRFVPAICFEDVDSRLMARQFAGPNHTKRADFIVNLTNDGWFAGGQMAQHLQLATFRSIENRVPIARSVNTGISGFIDSVGRVQDTLPVHTTGTLTARLDLDRRVAPYTHLGDVFAGTCLVATLGLSLWAVWIGMKNRKSQDR
jgi:apolipoprotein N-acyltransferase